MKLFLLSVKNWWVMVTLLCGSATLAHAQAERISIEQLDKLAAAAENTVEVSLDERLLQVAAKFLNKNDPAQAKARELIAGLKGVYVRVFSFDKPGEYAMSDVEPLRQQVRGSGWQKIVGVRSKRDGDNVDVHLHMLNDNINGLVIIAAQPKELVVVNILGPIDLEKLSQLQGQLGIPKLDLERSKARD
jgi:hypothetical protein